MLKQLKTEWLAKHSPRYHNPNPMVRKLGFGPEGKHCQDCKQLICRQQSRRWYKCLLRGVSKGAGTDHRMRWDACAKFEERADETKAS